MSRFSAKTIVILSAICFIVLAGLQIVWLQSAYQSEKDLYEREKHQFEDELQTRLERHAEFKTGLQAFLDHYNQQQRLDTAQMDWFYYHLVQTVQFSPQGQGVHLNGVAIVKVVPGSTTSSPATDVLVIPQHYKPAEMAEAGRLCVACILGRPGVKDSPYNYQILLFYKNPWETFIEKMGFLILASLLLLIVLGFLFRRINRNYSQEKKLSEAKNDFINNMTHEMQTPVFAIQMANRLIREKSGHDPELEPLTKIIEKEAGQLKLHASRILDLASMEQGQVIINKEMIELNSFIEQKYPTIELMLRPKRGELLLKTHANPLYVSIDQVHFNNVLLSLIDNTVKYSRDHLQVLIETGETREGRIYMALTDNGIGIRPEHLPFLFDKFYRVPDVDRKGIAGFGLGLSYVKHIVQLHGGEIKILSHEGRGTTVTILLSKPKANE